MTSSPAHGLGKGNGGDICEQAYLYMKILSFHMVMRMLHGVAGQERHRSERKEASSSDRYGQAARVLLARRSNYG